MASENEDKGNSGTLEPVILYEDADCAVLNKPAGLVVHADGRTAEPTLSDWVAERYPEAEGVGEPIVLADGTVIPKHGIVHRLDRETSGAIIVARNDAAFQFLKKQFQDRAVKKTYRTFVYGELKHEDGIIDRPIGRSTRDFRQWTASGGTRGTTREAMTAYRVLARGGGYSYVEALPKTGRTHQIRVHMKAIGHPVVGDVLYAGERPNTLGFTRTALHAFSVEFTAPSGAPVLVEAPLPADFEAAVAEIGKPC